MRYISSPRARGSSSNAAFFLADNIPCLLPSTKTLSSDNTFGTPSPASPLRICSFRYCNSLIDFYKLITKIVNNCQNIIIIPEEIKEEIEEEIEEETEPVQSKTGSKNQSIQIKFE